MRRRVVSLSTVAIVVAAGMLTGCTSVDPAQSCVPSFSSGAFSNNVRVSGDSADTLRVSFDPKLQALGTQRSIVDSSDEAGTVVQEGMIVAANIAYIDGVTGEVLQVSPSFGSELADTLFQATAENNNSLVTSSICASTGDSVVTVFSPEESASMGILDGSLIAVTQIVQAYEMQADGKHRALPSGFPAVTNDASGQPGVVLPPQQAPIQRQVALRIEGTGSVVKADDIVIGNVLTVGWDGVKTKNTWPTGPQSFLSEAEIGDTAPDFRSALTGFPIGSQVVVIEPGDGSASVNVIDILAVASR